MARSSIRDNTQRKQAEEQIARLYSEAQQEIERRKEAELHLRRANEDLDVFVSAISHDLQSPMNGVYSMVELLREECGGKLGPDGDLYLTHILDGVARSRRMILDLLDYSKAGHDETQERGSVELAKVLEFTELNLEAAIQKSHAAITHDALPEVQGNFVALAQLFQNLIENAIKYRAQDVPRIHIAADWKKDSWEVCISDNGIGIDPKYAEMIFDVFKRVYGTESEGAGIGLSLCRKIVERHGGRIRVESRLGEGARFYFHASDAIAAPAAE
jgi:light-regulated signal transduction histidine kinase (bacteriophytochrome)